MNGANSTMLGVITGKTPRGEATASSRAFDLVVTVRARRLQLQSVMDGSYIIYIIIMHTANAGGDTTAPRRESDVQQKAR